MQEQRALRVKAQETERMLSLPRVCLTCSCAVAYTVSTSCSSACLCAVFATGRTSLTGASPIQLDVDCEHTAPFTLR